jgi:tetratricopeptide (TPR) repeat protein
MDPPPNRQILRQFTQLFALIALTFAAYFPVLNNGFIWDDDRYIQNNSHLRTLRGLEQIWLEPLKAEPQYYPLTHTTLWVEFHLWKLHAIGYHLDNLLIHAAGAAMLWRILRRLKIPGALLAATIFAVHPLQVESVAWATERKNVLSALFCFLSLWAYLRTRWGRRVWDSSESGGGGAGWYGLSLLLFLAALLSKSVASTLPAAILVLVWWKRGRIRASDFYPLIPMLAAGIGMGFLTGWMEKHVVGAMGPDFDFLTPLDRFCIAGRAFWFYLAKLIWPVRLMFIYPRWNVDPREHHWWILFPLSACGALIGCWMLRRRIGRAAMLLFAVILTPAMGFVNVFPMRFSYVADHFQYLACIGPIVLLVAGAKRLGALSRSPGCTSGAACLAIACLCIATNLRTHVYFNHLTLWADTLAKNPDSPMVHNNYAAALMQSGDLEAAKSQFRQAMRLRHDAADWIGMGQCLAIAGDYLSARDMYQKAVDATPVSSEPVFQRFLAGDEFQLGTAYQGLAGEFPDQAEQYFPKAEAAYHRAIQLFPEYEDPRTNLASILVDQKKYSEAIQQCQIVLAENPESFSAYMNMGRAYYAEGNLDSALNAYQSALDLDPQNPGAMASVGAILAQTGQIDRGIAMLQEAIRIDPDNAIARRNLLAAMAKKSR